MEIILKQDVDNLGHKDQIVNVRPGYANNYLIPQGYAISATVSAKKILAENIKQRAHKEEKMVKDATSVAETLAAITLTIAAKASESGKIFGSVTNTNVAEAIAAKGIEVDKRNIKVEAIKELGSYKAIVKIYKDITAEVAIEVVAAE
ncbi:LSU ribosomal protein L9p [Mucinivorans hirudinis]|uniref:Large ribosomal subunit protein bL9 n=1 Tax=Mucinivorans hirudinis TaxID=1433126 RepID=A0A060RCW3_9BACT|nr:LSU ribosomal protein L9p [Mucinivorans hirudinis]